MKKTQDMTMRCGKRILIDVLVKILAVWSRSGCRSRRMSRRTSPSGAPRCERRKRILLPHRIVMPRVFFIRRVPLPGRAGPLLGRRNNRSSAPLLCRHCDSEPRLQLRRQPLRHQARR